MFCSVLAGWPLDECGAEPRTVAPADVGATDRVAVVRPAFAAHDEDEAPLADHVARISEGSVAVAHSITEPHRRLIVDEYVASVDGQFRLERVGTDLLRRAAAPWEAAAGHTAPHLTAEARVCQSAFSRRMKTCGSSSASWYKVLWAGAARSVSVTKPRLGAMQKASQAGSYPGVMSCASARAQSADCRLNQARVCYVKGADAGAPGSRNARDLAARRRRAAREQGVQRCEP
jgi:hypothetical protein